MHAHRYESVASITKFMTGKLVVIIQHFRFTVLRLASYDFLVVRYFPQVVDLWLRLFKNSYYLDENAFG